MKRPNTMQYTTISQSVSRGDDHEQGIDMHVEYNHNDNGTHSQSHNQSHDSNTKHKSNDATIRNKALNIDKVTSKSARNKTLFTITMAGTKSSRSGLYIRPSWKESLVNHFRNEEKRKATIILTIIVLSIRPLFLIFADQSNGLGMGVGNGHSSTGFGAGHEFDPIFAAQQDDDLISVPSDGYKTLSTTKAMKKIDHLCSDRLRVTPESEDCKCSNPMEATPGTYKGWKNAYELNMKLVQSKVDEQLDVVFLGDSIIEEWNGRMLGVNHPNLDEIQTVWTDLFQPSNSTSTSVTNGLALGIAGDTIANLLYRVQNGELEAVDPKVFWVLIGTNDLSVQCSENVILLGIIHIVEEIRKKKPDTIVVLNGMLPRTDSEDGRLIKRSGSGSENGNVTSSGVSSEITTSTSTSHSSSESSYSYWQSIQSINKGLQRYAEQHDEVEYFDPSDVFIVQMGNKVYQRDELFLVHELQRDYLHPSALGHRLWGEAIVNYIASDLDTPENLRKEYADRI